MNIEMGVAIDIRMECDAWASLHDVDAIAERAVTAAIAAGNATVVATTEVSIVLCDDAFIRTLNRDWLQRDRPTNVLSFPADPSARDTTLGDIVVAYETTAREAATEGRPLRDHLTHLIVHGTFHLLGYDHATDADADAMERLETNALVTLGIGSPYEDLPRLQAAP